jgi:hypothetical protein
VWRFLGHVQLSIAVKATFTLAPNGHASLRAPIDLVKNDVSFDRDPTQSLERASDLVPFRPQADVTFTGHAYAKKARRNAALGVAMAGLVLTVLVSPIVIGVGASTKDGPTSDRLAITGAVCIGAGIPMLLGGYIGAVDAEKHVAETDTRPRLGLAPVVARDHGGLSLTGTF